MEMSLRNVMFILVILFQIFALTFWPFRGHGSKFDTNSVNLYVEEAQISNKSNVSKIPIRTQPLSFNYTYEQWHYPEKLRPLRSVAASSLVAPLKTRLWMDFLFS